MNQKYLSRIYLVPSIILHLLICGICENTFAQSYSYEHQTIPLKGDFINFSGLSFLQDSDGYLWFGSKEGLYRYQGTGAKVFRHIQEDEHSLLDNFVYDMFEDSEGVMWIGTESGLNRYDKYTETFTSFTYNREDSTSIIWGRIHKITEDILHRLWLATSGGFSLYDRETGKFKNYVIESPDAFDVMSQYQIFYLFPDDEEYLWVTSGNGVYRFHIPSGNLEKINDIENDPNTEVYKDRSGRYWFICLKGLYLYDTVNQTYKRFTFPSKYLNKSESQVARTMIEDEMGNIWIRTYEGIYCYNQELELKYSIEHPYMYAVNPTNHKLLKELFIDQTGNIWYYTADGINQIIPKRSNFRAYDTDIQISNIILCVYPENKDLIWYGTNQGISSFDRRKNEYRMCFGDSVWKSGNPDGARSMYPGREGTLWIGMQTQGLFSMIRSENGERKIQKHQPEGTSSSNLRESGLLDLKYIFEDSSERLWVSGAGFNGQQFYDRLENRLFQLTDNPSAKDKLPVKGVIRHQTGSDTLWSIGSSGIYKIILPLIKVSDDRVMPTDVMKCRLYDETGQETGIPLVHRSYMDSVGTIWLGTKISGLIKAGRKKTSGAGAGEFTLKFYSTGEGLSSENIMSILPDDEGNLWIGTNNGLSKFNTLAETFTNYFVRHGLPANEFLIGSAATGADGELFFGTATGMISFYPENISYNEHVAPVMITGIRINNKPLQPGENSKLNTSISYIDNIGLQYNQDNISIEYAILNYNYPEWNQYRFKLEGFNDDWVTAGNRTHVDFTNLKPGKYTFHVSGSNNDGIWNEEGKSLGIIIHHPPWSCWYAWLIYVFILGGIILWIRRSMMNRAKLRLAVEIEKVEKQKAMEIDHIRSRFYTNISHEFRTPLTLLINPLEDAMKQDKESIEFSKRIMSVMHRNARRLQNLINQLLDISRIESGKMELQLRKANLSEFVRIIASSFYSLAESRQIQYQIDIHPDGEDSCFDADKTEKIVNNLLSNALKFCEEGGHVYLELEYAGSVNENHRQAEIKVRDTGKGIEQDQLDRIFDRFYQLSDGDTREVEGSGIGLALTRELVELMHGSIEVESTPGKGTTFTISFPVSEDSFSEQEIETMIEGVPPVEVDMGDGAEPSMHPENGVEIQGEELVLVVEDNPDLRSYIIEKFSKQYKVIEAENGEKGLRLAIEHIPDLVITDLMMPVMGGIEFCRKLKEHPVINHIPVIMLTAKADKDSRIEGLEAAADDYISKPFDTDLLFARVKNLINQRNELRKHFEKELILSNNEGRAASPQFTKLREIVKIIEANLDDADFEVESMASLLNMSRRGVFRKIRAVAGMTPHELIRIIRIKKAASLLRKGEMNVTEVMYQIGMRNLSSFALSFRKYYGINPGEYRKHQKA